MYAVAGARPQALPCRSELAPASSSRELFAWSFETMLTKLRVARKSGHLALTDVDILGIMLLGAFFSAMSAIVRLL